METLFEVFPVLRYLLLAIYVFALYYLAVKLEKRAWAYFDTKWLPPPERRKVKKPKGVRVLLVKKQDKQAVVLWAMLRTEALLLFAGIGVGLVSASAYIGKWYLDYWRSGGNIASASLPLFVYRLVAPFFLLQSVAVLIYWVSGWVSLRRRHIVRNDYSFSVRMRPTFIGLFSKRGAPDPIIIRERTSLLRRAVSAADIERIDPEQKTPWLRDQITFSLAGKRGLGSVLLPSETFGDVDTFEFAADVNQYLNCLFEAAVIGEEYEKSRERVGFVGDLEMYRVYQDTGSPDEAEGAREAVVDARETFDERISPEGYTDLFDEEDPGLCVGGELTIAEEELPAGTISIAPRYKKPSENAEPARTVVGQEPKSDEGDDDDRLPPSRLHSRK